MYIWCFVECSLKCLEIEWIELVLVYFDGNDLDIFENSEVYLIFVVFKCEGLIGVYGFFGKIVEGGLCVLCEGDCVMVIYNLNECVECLVIEYVVVYVKGILVKKVLVSGYVCLGVGQDLVCVSFELVFDQLGVVVVIVGIINLLYLVYNVVMVV